MAWRRAEQRGVKAGKKKRDCLLQLPLTQSHQPAWELHAATGAAFEPQIQSHPQMWEDPASVSGEEMTFTDS